MQVALSEPQYEFLTSDAPVALFSAGIGCLHESTPVDTWLGPRPFAECVGQFTSFDGQFSVETTGSRPFPKGKGMLYRVIHERGELLAYGSHLFFCSDHVYRRAHEAQAFLLSDHGSFWPRLLTNLDVCLSELRRGDGHWFQIAVNSLDRYLSDCRQYGLRLHSDLDSVRSLLPLLIDALECVHIYDQAVYAHEDGQAEPALAHNHLDQQFAHQSRLDYDRQQAVQLYGVAGFLSALVLERIWLGTQSSLLSDNLISHHHTEAVLHLGRTLVCALSRPYASSRVLSVEKSHEDWYWDCQVPGLNNYTGSGLIHHNSGKSFIGAHWAKDQLAREPLAKGFIGANTYNQLQNATLASFFAVLDDFNIPYRYNRQRNVINAAGRIVYAYSLENYDAIRGIEVGWAWLDETRDTPKAAFNVVLGRMRDRNCKRRLLRLTSSPNGFDWLYDDFAGPDKKPSYSVIFGRTQDNTFLPDGYAESLKESYDEKAYKQEVLGEFVNLTQGAIYYSFNRSKHVTDVARDPSAPVRVAIDFNVNPMSAVAFQDYNGVIHVIKDYSLMSSNTHELAQAIVNDYGTGIDVIPDSTGKALKTASRGLTDHAILRDYGLNVVTNRNPARMDRYNCVNNLLEKGRVMIDRSCKALIRDFEKVSYKQGTNHPDTADSRLTHVSDAFGYGAWYSYPIIRVSSGVVQIK